LNLNELEFKKDYLGMHLTPVKFKNNFLHNEGRLSKIFD
jgi:hypothetical protein